MPEYAVDFSALPRMRRLVEGYPRTFTYLIKTGAHLPYDDKSPPGGATVLEERRGRARGPSDKPIGTPSGGRPIISSASSRASSRHREGGTGGVHVGPRPMARRRAHRGAEDLAPCDCARSAAGAGLGAPAVARLRAENPGGARRALLHAPVRRSERVRDLPDAAPGGGLRGRGYARALPASLFESEAERPRRTFVSGNIFGANPGAYVLNRGFGDDCFVNDFDVDSVRVSSP